MGLFDFLKNKDKENAEINSYHKREIATLIEQAKNSCRSPEVISILRDIQREIESQTETSSAKVQELDAEIIKNLQAAIKYGKSQQAATAVTKLIDALEYTIDRSVHCSIGGNMTKADKKASKAAEKAMKKVAKTELTREEQLQEQIDQLELEKASLERRFQKISELNKEFPGNAALISRLKNIKAKHDAVKTKIVYVSNVANTEVSAEAANDITSTINDVVNTSTVNPVEVEITISEMNAAKQNAEQLVAAGQQLNAALGQSMGLEAPSLDLGYGSEISLDTSYGTSTTSMNTGISQTGPARQTQFGGFDASQMSSREMEKDIKKTIAAIEKQIEDCNDKIDDATDDFNDYNSQLRTLLSRRENASPSECLTLDGQIDELNSRRSSVMNKIKRYRQIKSNLSDRLSLMEKLGTQQDVSAMADRIQEVTGGRFADIEGLAMYLKQSVADSNEELENIGLAVAVSESEEINIGSTSATYAGLSDASNINIKDENKYDSLKMDLGMLVM